MTIRLLPAMLLACLCVTQPAFAETPGAQKDRPVFTETDRTVIARNRLLASLLDRDPWTVRRALDSMALTGREPPKDGSTNRTAPRAFPTTPSDDDLRDNPDLDQMLKAFPEAAHDLFQLIKQAGTKPPPRR